MVIEVVLPDLEVITFPLPAGLRLGEPAHRQQIARVVARALLAAG